MSQAPPTITAFANVLSVADHSHSRPVTDLIWLPPTLEVTEKGKFVRKDAETVSAEGLGNQQFVSISADGTLLFWDVRKSVEPTEAPTDAKATGAHAASPSKKKFEGWGPTSRMALPHPEEAVQLMPTSALLDVEDDPSGRCALTCVTQEGELASIELHHPSAEGFTKGVKSAFVAHTGPAVALERSPFVPGCAASCLMKPTPLPV